MKRLLGLLIGSMLFLAACGNYEGTVIEKTDSSFILEVTTDNSKAGSPVHEKIYLIDPTIFSGAARSFEELKEGDRVTVVPAELSEDFPYILASEVNVEWRHQSGLVLVFLLGFKSARPTRTQVLS
ncbi:hypothetical protein [Planomicrobium sp. CPCC 101079]|uniref:hypothetical protein n=1 Tax=Planomicrobium sp. CPCC 101079 TaxID=2599618 RepID=UPI0011B6419D|nr:hypothetical protein [Planomicrobium sp. CPCC 101079]TWT00571.1 hypothetical protein FQV28_17855 [Planomicrobium sp. CPCC 101079]